MSRTDRWIILICVVAAAALLTGAASLMPRINRMRTSLQLTANDDVMENLPPDIAFTQAALGSFRGLAVDVLWMRATQLKQEGKFHEAMQLANWITKLQPRFPQVWAFHAWNMAYNISVATSTPQERWMWVNAGIDLLRNEGIPLNPNSVLLHKELGWIYLHKIGKLSDDMHWYYKRKLAQRWHALLGPPPTGGTEQVLEWFKPIADAYGQYLLTDRLGMELRHALDRIARQHPELREGLQRLRPMSLDTFRIELNNLRRRLRAEGQKRLDAQLGPLFELLAAQKRRAAKEPFQRLLADHPEAAALRKTLAGMGFELNEALLRRITLVRAADSSRDLKALGLRESPRHAETNQRLRDWLADSAIAGPRDALLAYLRAKVLKQRYRMDPLWMYQLMRGRWFIAPEERAEVDRSPAIPIDWRHPAAHGLYWSSRGVLKAQGLLKPGNYDVLNTDRQILHALQALTHNGRLVFDPVSGYYRQAPDPRFIDAYNRAVFGAPERIRDKQWDSPDAPESFEAGHENFLIWATQATYFYGDREQARRYYERLRKLYSDRQPDRVQRYSKPLEQFVFGELVDNESLTNLDDARSAIDGMIFRAIRQGLSAGRGGVAERFLDQARQAHRYYQNEQATGPTKGDRKRLSLPPFGDMLADAFTRYLTGSTGGDALSKSRAWRNAPAELRRRVFRRAGDQIHQRARRAGLDPERAFPPPPGMGEPNTSGENGGS